jgi:nitroreductase
MAVTAVGEARFIKVVAPVAAMAVGTIDVTAVARGVATVRMGLMVPADMRRTVARHTLLVTSPSHSCSLATITTKWQRLFPPHRQRKPNVNQ